MGKVKTCTVKVGAPDIACGMDQCGMPCVFIQAGEIVDGAPTQYTGWRHVYSGHDADHWPIPAGWA